MEDKQEIKQLFELLSHLNHRQWEITKEIVDIAFEEEISFENVEELICEDLIKNGL